MTLNEVKAAVDNLSPSERAALIAYLEGTPLPEDYKGIAAAKAVFEAAQPIAVTPGKMDVEQLLAAFKAMRDELSAEEIDTLIEAMNRRIIHPND